MLFCLSLSLKDQENLSRFDFCEDFFQTHFSLI